ncbi:MULTISPECIES: hypothetical protein [Vibrio]|uniref:hypothetical protein n=1 Tax=Vibrio TaxID=662 RepID=UPI002074B0D7|nr:MULTISPECIES: hypothetical protein [Vibrio]USD35606.1 hypothetical protein J8Z27_22625 [Vibrio sp. SCSIO 43186]USD72730.1 hypothetical protein J4N41_22630 [Vibrio sp. SCSIO 43139]
MVNKFWLFELGMLVWLGIVIYGFFTAWTLPLVSAITILTLVMSAHMYRKNKQDDS